MGKGGSDTHLSLLNHTRWVSLSLDPPCSLKRFPVRVQIAAAAILALFAPEQE
jgi:hypothetical protein